MDKKICLCLAALCCGILLLASCGKQQPLPPDTTQSAPVTEGTAPTAGDTVPEDTAATTEPSTEPQVEVGVGSREDFEDGPQNTKPTQPEATEPTVPSGPAVDTSDPSQVTYAQFLAMPDEERERFVDSFPSLKDFLAWRDAAAEKEPYHDPEILDGNEIDLGKLTP